MDDPSLPYAGTSGWSGSATSKDRATRDDADGTTTFRQSQIIHFLAGRGIQGATWKEAADHLGWHHGQVSGTLSVLHKVEKIDRLIERRNRCAVYVLPQFRMGRPSTAQGRKTRRAAVEPILRELIASVREVADWNRGSASSRALIARANRAEVRLREIEGTEK